MLRSVYMEGLDLPEIKGVPFEKKWLLMDD